MHHFPLVEVSGTPRQMGRQHGEQAAALIAGYLTWIEKTTGKDRDELGRRAHAFEPFIDTLNPLLLDEIRGLAEGAAISYDHALLCQARGEATRAPPSPSPGLPLAGATPWPARTKIYPPNFPTSASSRTSSHLMVAPALSPLPSLASSAIWA